MFKLKIIFYWIQFKLRAKFRERKTIEKFQYDKLQLFFKKVLPLSPFYARLVKEENVLSDFPLVNKNFYMENFDELNTKGISKKEALQTALKAESDRDFSSTIKDITIGLSTGTSGKRGIFLVAEEERAQWAAMVMARVVQPKLFKKQKVAFFLRANSNLYSSVQSALFEFRYFDIFKPIEILAKEVEEFQPDILAAQPSVLSDLAEFQKSGRIKIQPEKIISFAEVLYPEDKAFILSVFKAEFKEVYQCTEGFLGVKF
jgi:putative adenylate-forming enzyme